MINYERSKNKIMGRFMIPCCCICGASSKKWHDEEWENNGGLQDFCPTHAKDLVLKEYLVFEFIKNLYVIQSGKCAICNKQISEELISKRYGLAIDHCHDSNKIRGLLCYSCNSGIGLFHDNVEYLQNAINYLKEHKE